MGSVVVHGLFGAGPAPQTAVAEPAPVSSVAQQLGLTAQDTALDTVDLAPLQDMAVSRNARQDAQAAAQQAQAAADQAVVDQQAAAAAATAQAEAAAAVVAAQAATDAAAAAVAATSAASTAVTTIARISNSSGPVSAAVQAAADAVVSNVPGAADLTLGGTRPSAADPSGHPSGNALDYMALSDTSLGDAIVQYHRDHWAELGVDYLIYQQRMLSSPNGSWVSMEDRGSATANHEDHVHVNYR